MSEGTKSKAWRPPSAEKMARLYDHIVMLEECIKLAERERDEARARIAELEATDED